jgi:uncharacterized membrane protein
MEDATRYGSASHRYRAPVVVAIGLSHYLWPRLFDPINRLGFPNDPHRHTYINGAIETAIGVSMARPEIRWLSTIASTCYVVYLTGNIIRARTAGGSKIPFAATPSPSQ